MSETVQAEEEPIVFQNNRQAVEDEDTVSVDSYRLTTKAIKNQFWGLDGDKSRCQIYKDIVQNNKQIRRLAFDTFSTSDVPGSNIRDAEHGSYYRSKVGSRDEDLFFKVRMCDTNFRKGKNGSRTLFFLSPEHFSRYLLEPEGLKSDSFLSAANMWREKQHLRLEERAASKA